ncbi:MAG: SRPBCC family protein [Candidatus Ranarchaeia archaeon]|jgi:hypothetical protein
MPTYAQSVIVNADIAEVWQLISDLPYLGDMLPQVHKVEWASEQTRGVGTKSLWYPKHRPEKANLEEVVDYQPPHIFAWMSKRPSVPGRPETGFINVRGQLTLDNIERFKTKVTFSEDFPKEIEDLSVFEGKTTQELNAIRDYFDQKRQPRRVIISRSRMIKTSPKVLFEQIRDVAKVSEHVPTVKTVEILSEKSVGKGTRSKWNSRRVPGRWHYEEVTEFEEDKEFGWIAIGMNEELRVKGILEFFETPEGHTTVRFTEKFLFPADDDEIQAHIEGMDKQLKKMEQDAGL